MQRNYNYIFKIVMIGSSSVGKSSILKRFADDEFQQSYISTIGIDFRFKSLTVDDNYLKLQIWDTAGQQRFRGITKSYYKGAHAVILVFDISNPQSFSDIVHYWFKEIKSNVNQAHIFLFANKCDTKGIKLTQEQLAFVAKTGHGVKQSIIDIAKELMKVFPMQPKDKLTMGLKETNLQQQSGCCKK